VRAPRLLLCRDGLRGAAFGRYPRAPPTPSPYRLRRGPGASARPRNDAVDFNLTKVEREQAAGSFSIDLVAEDDYGGTVVIENQLERSNHDHLGKLITYTALTEARAAIGSWPIRVQST
jgi:hypothetical protein